MHLSDQNCYLHSTINLNYKALIFFVTVNNMSIGIFTKFATQAPLAASLLYMSHTAQLQPEDGDHIQES